MIDLDVVSKLCEKISDSWDTIQNCYPSGSCDIVRSNSAIPEGLESIAECVTPADANFIVTARKTLPELIDLIKKARELLINAQGQVDAQWEHGQELVVDIEIWLNRIK